MNLDDLDTVVDEQTARMAVSLALQTLRDRERATDQARDRLCDVLAVANRAGLSFGTLAELTGLDKGHLHRMAKASTLYHGRNGSRAGQ